MVCGSSVFGPCFAMQYLVLFLFCNHLDWEERADCFTLFVLLLSCDCYCSFAHCTVPRVGLPWVIVVFPDHIQNYLFI